MSKIDTILIQIYQLECLIIYTILSAILPILKLSGDDQFAMEKLLMSMGFQAYSDISFFPKEIISKIILQMRIQALLLIYIIIMGITQTIAKAI